MGTKAKIFSSSYLDNVTFSGENYRKGDKQERVNIVEIIMRRRI